MSLLSPGTPVARAQYTPTRSSLPYTHPFINITMVNVQKQFEKAADIVRSADPNKAAKKPSQDQQLAVSGRL